MKKERSVAILSLFLLALVLFISACTLEEENKGLNSDKTTIRTVSDLGSESSSDGEKQKTPEQIYEKDSPSPAVNDQYPSISTTVSPSNPSLGELLTFTISAEDDYGIKQFSWTSDKIFSNSADKEMYNCNQQKTCTRAWELMPNEEGLYQFTISVEDIGGNKMDNVKAEATVGPSREPTPSETPSSGSDNYSSSSSTSSSTTQQPYFTCGNSVCEGGESYESCSDDCTLQDILGTNPGNGACEPGEDVDNAPNDCTVINKQCGNNVCDSGEDQLSCYYDCKSDNGDTESSGSCSTNSDCGYKQRCRSGSCESVECTSDSQCTGCRRCSDYQCVSCGYGAAGYCSC